MTRATEMLLTAAPNPYRCPEVATVPKKPEMLGCVDLVWCTDCPHKIPCRAYRDAFDLSGEGRLS